MRISIDCRYIRERPSGIGRYVQALIERVPRLAPLDHFHLWKDPRAQKPLALFPNVTEERISAPANTIRTLAWPSRLADLRGADVLHAPFNLLGRGIACPTVVTLHDLMWLSHPKMCEGVHLRTPFQIFFYRWGIQNALKKATRMIAISNATADEIRSLAPEAAKKLCVIRHGVDLKFRPPADRESARRRAAELLGTADPYFLVVGQNAPYKNHRMILEAYAAAGLGPQVKLVMLQRLLANSSLKRRALKLGLGNRVIWPGGFGEADLLVLLQSALALIQFSLFEGFGMPALEAMACGTPVIASRIAPFEEILGKAGILAPLKAGALVALLRKAVREPQWLAEHGAMGMERSRLFSWDASAKAHLEVYREAAADGAGDFKAEGRPANASRGTA